jgi:hypothetical protein
LEPLEDPFDLELLELGTFSLPSPFEPLDPLLSLEAEALSLEAEALSLEAEALFLEAEALSMEAEAGTL